MAGDSPSISSGEKPGRRDEILTFFLLTFVVAPAVTIGIVGGFGLCIWLYQLFAGPPGPPGG
jgi:periplasmic nitrate reductase NapE